MIAIIGLGTFLGVQLDKKTDSETSFYTLILSLLSVFVALAFTIRQILHKPNNKNEHKS